MHENYGMKTVGRIQNKDIKAFRFQKKIIKYSA